MSCGSVGTTGPIGVGGRFTPKPFWLMLIRRPSSPRKCGLRASRAAWQRILTAEIVERWHGGPFATFLHAVESLAGLWPRMRAAGSSHTRSYRRILTRKNSSATSARAATP